jgi:serine/threonine protein kinase
MCGALHEAHQRGLIHRDVKPANAILCERGDLGDVVKVLDFGLAKELRKPDAPPGHGDRPSLGPASLSADETQFGVISGTPQYLAPEAIQRPTEVDARTDLYALGCVGYFLLTGSEVFPKLSVTDVFAHHVHVVPIPPSQRLETVGADGTDLEKVILWCLEKDPARRPADARALSDALASCAAAGSWTEALARAWWREHRAKATRTERELAGFAPTLAVDSGQTVKDADPARV